MDETTESKEVGKTSISEQELVEWKLWAEKWLVEDTAPISSQTDLKAK